MSVAPCMGSPLIFSWKEQVVSSSFPFHSHTSDIVWPVVPVCASQWVGREQGRSPCWPYFVSMWMKKWCVLTSVTDSTKGQMTCWLQTCVHQAEPGSGWVWLQRFVILHSLLLLFFSTNSMLFCFYFILIWARAPYRLSLIVRFKQFSISKLIS